MKEPLLTGIRVFQIFSIFIVYFLPVGICLIIYLSLNKRGVSAVYLGIILSKLAESLGPTAIKMAQVASSRSDLFPKQIIKPLTRMQDEVKPPSRRQIIKQIKNAFPGEPGGDFFEIDWAPIASGSVAYVLAARKKNGHKVALKVVRSGVKDKISRDFKIIGWIIRFVSKQTKLKGIPIVEVFSLFSNIVNKQCNMLIEAENICKFQKFVGSEILLPSVDSDLTQECVLVMTYMNIWRNIDSPNIPQSKYEDACVKLLHEVYRMIFIHGLVHGDLHPGNVSLDKFGRVILVDFGLIAEMKKIDRRRFRNLFFGIATGDSKLVTLTILDSSSTVPDNFEMSAFEQSVQHLVSRRTGQKAGEFLVTQFTNEIFDLQKEYGLYGTPGFANAIWALAMYEGLVRERFPQLDFQEVSRKFLMMPYVNTVTIDKTP